MKRKISGNNGGFTLIEVVVAITVLALVAAPVGGALAVSGRVNAYADRVLQARLNVSAVAETLMQEGIKEDSISSSTPSAEYKKYDNDIGVAAKHGVEVEVKDQGSDLYEVKITSISVSSVMIKTQIRAAGVGDAGGAGS